MPSTWRYALETESLSPLAADRRARHAGYPSSGSSSGQGSDGLVSGFGGVCAGYRGSSRWGAVAGRSSGFTGASGSDAHAITLGILIESNEKISAREALCGVCLHVMRNLFSIHYRQRRALVQSHLEELIHATIIITIVIFIG